MCNINKTTQVFKLFKVDTVSWQFDNFSIYAYAQTKEKCSTL